MPDVTLLRDFRNWFEQVEPHLRDAGVETRLDQSPEERGKRSLSFDIESGDRLGQLIVWDSGELDLRAGRRGAKNLLLDEHNTVESGAALQPYLVLLLHAVVAQSRRSKPATLTPREREVLELLAEGASNREIAQRLVLSESTVRDHLSRMYRKLGVSRRAEMDKLIPVDIPFSFDGEKSPGARRSTKQTAIGTASRPMRRPRRK